MPRQIKLSHIAKKDISKALKKTLVDFGERKHDEYGDLIEEALAKLIDNPEQYPSKSRPELYPNARTLHIAQKGRKARHLFVYRVKDNGDVDIARFLYDGMDIKRHLVEGEETP